MSSTSTGRLRVLFAYPFCGLGGVETALVNRASGLAALGIDASVSLGVRYGAGASSLARLPRVTVGREEGALASLHAGGFDVVVAVDHPEFVERLDPDVPAVVLFETHTADLDAARGFYEGIAHPLVRAVLVPSEFNRQQVLGLTSTKKPIHVVPNAIDLVRFSLRPPGEVEAMWGAIGRGPVVVWIGRIEEAKNPLELVRIAEALAPTLPQVRYLVVGDAVDDREFGEAVRGAVPRQLRDRFEFRAAVPFDEMPLVYSLAAASGGCLLSTSLWEAAPMIFLEAMACGCPVVSTDVGGVGPLLADVGWLYRPGDVAGAAELLRRLLGGEAERAAAVENGTERVARHESGRAAEAYAAALESVIGSTVRRSFHVLAMGAAVDVPAECPDWYLRVGTDERWHSPFPGLSLEEAVEWVDRHGYNAIGARGEPRGWKRGSPPVTEGWTGGPEPFDERRLFPIEFVVDDAETGSFDLDRARLEALVENDSVREARAEHAELLESVRRLRRAMDVEGEIVARALRLVESRRLAE